MSDPSFSILPACAEQAGAVSRLLDPYVEQGLVLPRSSDEICRNIADFLVACAGEEIIGAVAVRDFGAGLFEIRSLVVLPDYAGRGLGSRLVGAAVKLAESRRAMRIFALTMRPHLFERLHFIQVDKNLFPQKVWSDCVKCPKRACCDEVAVLLDTVRVHRRFG